MPAAPLHVARVAMSGSVLVVEPWKWYRAHRRGGHCHLPCQQDSL